MKRFLLLVIQVSFAFLVFAEPVGSELAKTIAKNAYFQKVNQYHQPVSYTDLAITSHYVISQDGDNVIYAFNFDHYGFILIAADDAIEPVLGYTFDHHYSITNQPDNFRGLLWQYGEQIRYLRDNKISASAGIIDQWNELAYFNPAQFSPKDSGKDIEPLMTATWNQDWPYNYYCPPYASGPNGHVYVGCVATAMSQIMYYWRYPHQGSGSHSYYQYPYGQDRKSVV